VTTEIKNCPLACNGEAELAVVDHTFDGPGYSFCRCKKCGISGPVSKLDRHSSPRNPDRKKVEREHDEDSIRLWNLR